MTKLSNRDKLRRLIQGENLDDSVHYYIEYSLDIRGNITIWGGMEYLRDEANICDNVSKIVDRRLTALYEYNRLSPYTARIFQMEQELDETITDEALIEALTKFREERPTEGFGFRFVIDNLLHQGAVLDEQGRELTPERRDKQEVLDRLLKQERKDILKLWGVDCPPNINDSEHYGERLRQDRGQVSDWYKQEFKRIGGDFDKLWRRD